MIALSCKDIRLSYGIDVILDGVTFNINEGDKVSLIGANGAGKTSLFRILTRQLKEDSGEFFIDRNRTVGYLAQDLSLDTSKTIHEEVISVFSHLTDMEKKMVSLEEEMAKPYDIENNEYHNKVITDYARTQELYDMHGGYTYKGEMNKVLSGLGFTEEDYGKKVSILSGGQKTRVALSKLLLSNPDILLLDEPTNHLDLKAIEWLEEYLQAYKGTILIISHDRFFLDSITSHTFDMINGKVYTYHAPYTRSLELKEKNYEVQLKAYRQQQEEIKRQEDIIERYRSFNREKSIKAAESRQKQLDKIERIEAPPKDGKAAKISLLADVESGNDVLFARDLSKSYGDNLLFENVSFDIRKRERIALIGDNGRGKTTLFRMILERVQPDTGYLTLGKNVTLGYYDQEQSDLTDEKTVLDEVWDTFPELSTKDVRTYLGSYLFKGDEVFKLVSNLSGGERCRVNLLKLMLRKSNFLLLDEPTNHLDIPSREALENSLLDYEGTLFVISHDRYFLNKVVNQIYELKSEGIVKYLGNYSYYLEKKKNPDRYEGIETEEKVSKTKTVEEKKKRKEVEKSEKARKQRFSEIESGIDRLEKRKLALNDDLCREEVYSDNERTSAIALELKTIETDLHDLYEEWEAYME
jgi:ATP-binding cassette subfamily F protein 3